MTFQTELLFRDDPYLARTTATVIGRTEAGLILDRTIFYAASGGQPADHGFVAFGDSRFSLADVIHPDGDKNVVVHVPAPGDPVPDLGAEVICHLDMERRQRLMRMHTALHLATVVFPFPITGAAVGTDKGRIDFDMPELPGEKDELEARLNALVADDHPVTTEWITDDELEANPGLIKSLSVSPPRGQGRVRLVRIGTGDNSIDLQPCGGTHVRSTAEIGRLRIGKIEKKGKQNRRVNLFFAEENPA